MPLSLFNQFARPNDGISGVPGGRGAFGAWEFPKAIDESGAIAPIDYSSGIEAALAENAAKSPPKPSFFGKGGVGRNIAGLLGDYLAQLGGGQAVYAPLMEHQRALELYEKKRRDDWDDWQRRRFWSGGASNVGGEHFGEG